MNKIQIDETKCINCGVCDKVCMLTKFCGYEDFKTADKNFCVDCGHCVAACPAGAISHKEINHCDEISKIPSVEETVNLIMKARTIRDFKDKKIDEEIITLLKKICSYSQSGLNSQSVRPIFITDKKQLKEIKNCVLEMYNFIEKVYHVPFMKSVMKMFLGEKNFESLKKEILTQKVRKKADSKGKDCVLYDAPVLVLFYAPSKNLTAYDDACIMAQNMMLTAYSMGLGACYMGCITAGCNMMNWEKLKKSLNIPKGQKVFQAFVLGHPTYSFKKMPERKAI